MSNAGVPAIALTCHLIIVLPLLRNAEMAGGLLKTDFKNINKELGPTSALAGSMFVVHAEVSNGYGEEQEQEQCR